MPDNNKPDTVPASRQKQALRNQLRTLRRSLSPEQQFQASCGVLAHIIQLPVYQNARHIAVYLAQDGELDPALLVEQAWKDGKTVYLPVIEPEHQKTLLFLPWTEDTFTVENRFGIPEPDINRYPAKPTSEIDVIFLPLTGFDASGRRLGMGGGFYDRTLSFVLNQQYENKRIEKPELIGLAHECQKTHQLPQERWDIPVSAIITDQHRYQSDH